MKNKKASHIVENALAYLIKALPSAAILPTLNALLKGNTKDLSLPKFTLDKEKLGHFQQLFITRNPNYNRLILATEDSYHVQVQASMRATKLKLLALVGLFVLYTVIIRTYLSPENASRPVFDSIAKQMQSLPPDELWPILLGQKKFDWSLADNSISAISQAAYNKMNAGQNFFYLSSVIAGLVILSLCIDLYKNTWAFSPLDLVKKTPTLNKSLITAERNFNTYIMEQTKAHIFSSGLDHSSFDTATENFVAQPFFEKSSMSATKESHELAKALLQRKAQKELSKAERYRTMPSQ